MKIPLLVLICAVVSFMITCVLYQKGKFNDIRKTEHTALTALGVILPFVDVIETWIGFEFEGNPIVESLISLVQDGWIIFILFHVGASVLAFILGWQGKSEETVEARVGLAFLVIFLATLTSLNAILLKLYGVF